MGKKGMRIPARSWFSVDFLFHVGVVVIQASQVVHWDISHERRWSAQAVHASQLASAHRHA